MPRRPKKDPRAAERQRDALNREARATFGRSARMTEVGTTGYDPQRQRQEEDRLSARHDPTKPSACRLCAITVAPTDDAVSGWKCCDRCRVLLAGGLPAVWAELLDDSITGVELSGMIERRVINPSRFVTGWPTESGNRGRWEHVALEQLALARSALDAVRDEARLATVPRPNSYGTGCCWCGRSTSVAWTDAPWRFGRGPTAPRGALCSSCAPWATRSGVLHGDSEGAWRTWLFAACVGLPRAQMGLHYDLRAYFESEPADISGTAEPWQYLGTVRAKLRAKIIRRFPGKVDLTDAERRVLAVEAAMVEPPGARPLATID